MNDQNITQAFGEITAQADACLVERNVREHQMKKNAIFTKRPIRATAVLAAVLVLIMVPAAAFGIVYGYHAYQTEHGYAVTAETNTAPIKLDEQTMEELAQYILRFDKETVNINDIGKRFETYDALDTWLGGILLTSPMLDGESVVYCTVDNTGEPVAVHVSSTNAACAVNITIPLVGLGADSEWITKGADMLSSQIITAENGIEAEFVTTETSVTAYFMQGGILYRLNIAGNHEKATAVLSDIISTMK
ncbi:MAG: hypothetical protein IKZ09_01340 [Clostridia bacterium]|nr:hypothetical protein [Clostridia bacterium]